MSKAWFKIIPILLLLLSCNRKNIPQKVLPVVNNIASDIIIKNTDFQYFSSKSTFILKDNNDNIEATANLRMKKDSIIWINVSPGLGIEALRAIITPDSMVIVDKIKKKYIVYDFPTLSHKFNFPISFNIIQDLLLGNTVKEKSDSDKVLKEANYYVLNQNIKNSLVENFINETSAKLDRIVFSEKGTNNLLTVEYGKIALYDSDKVIPNEISIELDYTYQNKNYNVSIDIDHLKAEFSDKSLKFPFNIPAKYERVE